MRATADLGADKRRKNIKPLVVAAVCTVLLTIGGCAAPPPATSLTAAADPRVPVPAARYSSVTAPYTRQRPVEPLPWLERNQRVAPQAPQ